MTYVKKAIEAMEEELKKDIQKLDSKEKMKEQNKISC